MSAVGPCALKPALGPLYPPRTSRGTASHNHLSNRSIFDKTAFKEDAGLDICLPKCKIYIKGLTLSEGREEV